MLVGERMCHDEGTIAGPAWSAAGRWGAAGVAARGVFRNTADVWQITPKH